MPSYLESLENAFYSHSNQEIAQGQKAYMKNQFEFLGLKSPIRRPLQREFLIKMALPPKSELEKIIKTLWEKPEREFQYFAQELMDKYQKEMTREDIYLLEYMVLTKSWWDTVDFIASHLLGAYFKKFPDERGPMVEKWLASGNIWLQRCFLLFQFNYKESLNTDLLESIIQPLLGSKEFFINKAIGWILPQYSKTSPQWVREFVKNHPLENLSEREAMRLIK
ncbi:DNA alkylation repair protein [Echinicola jeungdonensis]|uniref:DNA alkylation repair protein n=1 Tax=Echinicola jeungdonensis TaxID=709343 RepID=A0ABV5J840_9BACT|nr:DNA alkylation repair protein [Echinicola jeungdonensis]MDN3669176.1 DNA alkylation repair protein [Echinicola jeungdonensis]